MGDARRKAVPLCDVHPANDRSEIQGGPERKRADYGSRQRFLSQGRRPELTWRNELSTDTSGCLSYACSTIIGWTKGRPSSTEFRIRKLRRISLKEINGYLHMIC